MATLAHYLVAALLFFLVAPAFVAFAPISHAAQTGAAGNWLNNSEQFNIYGQYLVNETVYQTVNSTSSLGSVTLGFPSVYAGHIAALKSSAASGSGTYSTSVDVSTANNSIYYTLKIQPALPANANGSVSLSFYVLDSFKATGSGNYTAPVLYVPSISIPLEKVVSTLVFPYSTTYVGDSTPLQKAGFSQTVGTNATSETFLYTGTNISSTVPRWDPALPINSAPAYSGMIDFPSITRQLSIDSSGNLVVRDTLTIKNLGQNTLSSLNYTPLTTAASITLIPSAEPPLSNVGTTTVVSGQLDLNSSNKQVEPNSAETIILEYPLGSTYWSFSNGVYHVTIPKTPPVSAVVGNDLISYTASSGVFILPGSQLPLSAVNSTGSTGIATLSYRLGIGSAYGSALPLAAILFIAAFIAGVVFKPKMEAGEDVGSTFDSLVKAIEDKVSGINDILSDLKSKGTTPARNDLVIARTRIDEFRAKSSGRLGALRTELSSSSVTVQAGVNEVIANDREFDRAVRDILNAYEQLITKRMREDTFARLQQSNERRLQNVTNKLIDSVHDVREEYESED